MRGKKVQSVDAVPTCTFSISLPVTIESKEFLRVAFGGPYFQGSVGSGPCVLYHYDRSHRADAGFPSKATKMR